MAGWDLVYDHLLALLPTLDGLSTVFDGMPLVKETPPTFAVVGDDGQGNSGSFQQDYDTIDGLVSEIGEVACLLIAQTGDTDFAPLRAQIKAWTDALNASLRADKTLGGLLMQGSSVAVARVEPAQWRNNNGTVVGATVAVGYQTRL